MFRKLFMVALAVFWLVFAVTPVTAVTPTKANVVKKMVPAKQPVKKVVSTAPADWFVYEAMWIGGGQEYQSAVHRLASVYSTKMDKHCNVPMFDVTVAAKEYAAATPRGAESIRDSFIRKQIATLACITMYGERHTALEQMM